MVILIIKVLGVVAVGAWVFVKLWLSGRGYLSSQIFNVKNKLYFFRMQVCY